MPYRSRTVNAFQATEYRLKGCRGRFSAASWMKFARPNLWCCFAHNGRLDGPRSFHVVADRASDPVPNYTELCVHNGVRTANLVSYGGPARCPPTHSQTVVVGDEMTRRSVRCCDTRCPDVNVGHQLRKYELRSCFKCSSS